MSKVQHQQNQNQSSASHGKGAEASTFNGVIIFDNPTRDEHDEVQQFSTSLEKIGHPRFTTNAQVSASILSSGESVLTPPPESYLDFDPTKSYMKRSTKGRLSIPINKVRSKEPSGLNSARRKIIKLKQHLPSRKYEQYFS